uniref:Uncharacterized protein n=1 Tax=Salix viminalis TaxID=40686 RepID=A0A6N2K370_SALVM
MRQSGPSSRQLNNKNGCPWLTPMLNPVQEGGQVSVAVLDLQGRSYQRHKMKGGAHGGSKYKLMASKKMEYCRNLISSERNWKMEEYSKADQERNKELQCGTSVNNNFVELLFTLISHHKANMGLRIGDRCDRILWHGKGVKQLSYFPRFFLQAPFCLCLPGKMVRANRWQRRGQIYLAITDFQIISKGYRIIAYKHANTIAETEEMQF